MLKKCTIDLRKDTTQKVKYSMSATRDLMIVTLRLGGSQEDKEFWREKRRRAANYGLRFKVFSNKAENE